MLGQQISYPCIITTCIDDDDDQWQIQKFRIGLAREVHPKIFWLSRPVSVRKSIYDTRNFCHSQLESCLKSELNNSKHATLGLDKRQQNSSSYTGEIVVCSEMIVVNKASLFLTQLVALTINLLCILLQTVSPFAAVADPRVKKVGSRNDGIFISIKIH